MRRIGILMAVILIAGSAAFAQENTMKKKNPLKIHIDSIVVDSHNDTMLRIIHEDSWLPLLDIRERTNLQADLVKLRAGNISVPFFAAYSSPFYGQPQKSVSRTLAIINALYWTEKNNRDIVAISSNYLDIQEAVLKGKIAAVPAIEGAYSITKENGRELLFQYRDLGVKSIGFTWNYSNELAEGLYGSYADSKGTQSSKGLTELGEEILRQMNSLGIILDVSHLSESSFWDVMELAQNPVIASHSGAYSITQHPRNLTDAQIEAIGENGGVIGVVYHQEFIGQVGNARVNDIVDHMEHIIGIVGIDHVGLGSDFDGAVLPLDMEDSSKTYRITQELHRRGYSEREIKKILGLNLLRVIKDNENRNLAGEGLGEVTIVPDFKMGEIFHKEKLQFTASISGNLEGTRTYAVLNGRKQPLEAVDGKLRFIPDKPLEEKFHVITFIAENQENGQTRETRIVYVQ